MSTRLTPVERLERQLSETAFADQVLGLAALLGWRSLAIRPARTKHGWVTPVAGDGRGYPDLTLVRARDRRLVFAELKREVGGVLSEDQMAWIEALRALVLGPDAEIARLAEAAPSKPWLPRIEVAVWRPSDLRDPIETSRIYEVLR